MESISATDLHALGDQIALIDVREDDELAKVRIPFAKHIPLSEFADRIDEVPDGAYIMCHGGGRSARTVTYLEQQGRTAVNVEGGISAWEAAGFPVERGDAGAEDGRGDVGSNDTGAAAD